MTDNKDFFRVQNYYPYLSGHSLPAVFVTLSASEITALADGNLSVSAVRKLDSAMRVLPRKRFISTDYGAPTDGMRFLSSKRGAVISAASAWNVLVTSLKIRTLASEGKVSGICIRPFRLFDLPREFRLFIQNGRLFAMSQRYLVRHFHRLERKRDLYWNIAASFVNATISELPVKDLVLDIYITSSGRVIVIDANAWGPGTDPLMMKTWEQDFSTAPLGLLLIPPPQTISGNVNVSF